MKKMAMLFAVVALGAVAALPGLAQASQRSQSGAPWETAQQVANSLVTYDIAWGDGTQDTVWTPIPTGSHGPPGSPWPVSASRASAESIARRACMSCARAGMNRATTSSPTNLSTMASRSTRTAAAVS